MREEISREQVPDHLGFGFHAPACSWNALDVYFCYGSGGYPMHLSVCL